MLGITEKNGKGFLFVEGKRYDGGYVDTKENKPKRDCEEIMTNSLNNFCKENNISTIDLLKMDIEGSEYKVFDSSTDFIKKNIKSIFVELHNIDKKNNYTEFKNNISKLDFVVEDEIMNRTLFLRNKKYLNEKI